MLRFPRPRPLPLWRSQIPESADWGPSRGSHRLGAIAAAVAAAFALLGVYSAQAALPSNVVDLPFERQLTQVPLLPQGWHFFTRPPREDRPVVYRERDLRHGEARDLLTPNAAPEHFFGLTRGGRAVLLEYGWIQYALTTTEALPQSEWFECESAASECVEELGDGPELASPYATPSLCGNLVVGARGARPWAWHQRGLDSTVPQRLQKVTVTC